jgi:leucyl aminopeptidase
MKIQLDLKGKIAKSTPRARGVFDKKEDEPTFKNGVILLDLGKKEKYTLEKLRRVVARALSQARSLGAASLAIEMQTLLGTFSEADGTRAAVEGARLSSYRFDKYKSKPGRSAIHRAPTTVTLTFRRGAVTALLQSSIRKALREAEIVCDAVVFTRDLANEPANVMTPSALAAAVKTMARKNGLICRVLGKSQIKKLGMGGILAVSQGSSFDPQFIILENRIRAGARRAAPQHQKPIVLVGKGITFDTGGISIKPAGEMDKMKFDMCGAAAVIGAMKAIANLKLPVRVIGLTPVCENMPGSKAQRPGDIIRILNGKTVEVLNTDAEGRLILADALSYAKRFSPRSLVDIATLTGACAATFSDVASGVMGTDPELVGRIREAGERTGERCWELPLWDEYGELIRASYADIQNISKKNAGTITAGMFLKEFTEHTRSWAHLDIAGTAWNNGSQKLLSPIGATGVGVRLLVEWIKSYI